MSSNKIIFFSSIGFSKSKERILKNNTVELKMKKNGCNHDLVS